MARKYMQKTVESQTSSGALFGIDSYKYRVVSAKVVGRRTYQGRNFYKYKIRYTER